MSEGIKIKISKDWLHMLIYAAIVAVGFLMPATGYITDLGWQIIGIFIGAVYGWCVTKEIWPALFSLAMLAFTGAMSFSDIIAKGFGNTTVVFLFFMFAYLELLRKYKVSEYLAAWIMSRKALKGRPWLIVFTIFFAALAISGLVNVFMGVILIWQVIYSISEKVGYEKHSKTPVLLILGVAIIGCLCLVIFPWSDQAMAMLGIFGNMLEGLNMPKYVFFTITISLLFILVYMLFCKFVFRIDVSKMKSLNTDTLFSEEEKKLNPYRKLCLISLAVVFVAFMLIAFLPATSGLKQVLSLVGYPGFMFIILGLLMLFQSKETGLVFQFRELSKGINWNVILIISTCMPLGSVLVSDAVGLTSFITNSILPLLSGMPKFLFFLLFAFVIVVLTNFLNNVPMCILFLPVAMSAAATFGVSPEQMGYMVIVCSVTAFLTAASSPLGTLLYSNGEWIKPKHIAKYGIPMVIIMIIVIALWNCYVFGLFY